MILPSPRAALLVVAALLPPLACAPLTTPERVALASAEPAILAADSFACAESAMIPVVGAIIAAVACPAEVAEVKRAIDAAVASPDAGAPLAPAVGQSTMMARVYRVGADGRRVAVGRVAAFAAGAVTAQMVGGKDGGR